MSIIIPNYKVISGFKEYGGKSAGLFLLKQNGFRAPNFYLINNETIQLFLNNKNKIPEVIDEWRKEYSISDNSLWAVRSSADVEDGKSESYAGLFNTDTNVCPLRIAESVANSIKTYNQLTTREYGSSKTVSYSIIIQVMISSEISGVVFSRNPLDSYRKEIALNILPGLGENLVSGREEGIRGIFRKRKFIWVNRENIYKGQIFREELKDISLSGNQLIEISLHFCRS